MRGRKRVAEQHEKENNSSQLTMYISILTIGLNSMSLKNVIDLTIF
jgi:hypothetical protein